MMYIDMLIQAAVVIVSFIVVVGAAFAVLAIFIALVGWLLSSLFL